MKPETPRRRRIVPRGLEHAPLGDASVIPPIEAPSVKQWKFLDSLARELGHPHGRSLAADLLGVQNWATMNLARAEASKAIEIARERLEKQRGGEEGKGGVRGGYG